MEDLIIVIKDVSQNFKEDSIGQAAIQINQIQDQEVHHDWINLFDDKGNMKEGKLLIEFRWIFSSVQNHFLMLRTNYLIIQYYLDEIF